MEITVLGTTRKVPCLVQHVEDTVQE